MKDGVRFVEQEEDLRACFKLRYRVYVENMGRLSDKSDHINKELYDEFDDNARVLIAVKKGKAIGTLRLSWGGDAPFAGSMLSDYRLIPFLNQIQKEKICIVERLMIDPDCRGSSLVVRMYKEVMHFVLEHKAEVVLLNCELHNLNAYLKLGFRAFGDVFDYPSIGPVVPMALIVGDYDHLVSVGSPVAYLITSRDVQYCCKTAEITKVVLNETPLSVANALPIIQKLKNLNKARKSLVNTRTFQFSERLQLRLSA
jgi:predicted GNAT family N-acyltransferase